MQQLSISSQKTRTERGCVIGCVIQKGERRRHFTPSLEASAALTDRQVHDLSHSSGGTDMFSMCLLSVYYYKFTVTQRQVAQANTQVNPPETTGGSLRGQGFLYWDDCEPKDKNKQEERRREKNSETAGRFKGQTAV